MKTIGLIGGMSWESTVTYYQVMNETVRDSLGSLHSAKILMYSIDFAPLAEYQEADRWDLCAQMMTDAAERLEKAGADFIVIGANTMHKSAEEVQKHISIPILHIAQATMDRMKADNIHVTALLGTKYTMCQDFYKKVLTDGGMQVIIPEDDVDTVNSIIYDELCRGILKPESKQTLLDIIEKLRKQGAEAVILGCTELGLLVTKDDTDLPVYDTALIHAEEAAFRALD